MTQIQELNTFLQKYPIKTENNLNIGYTNAQLAPLISQLFQSKAFKTHKQLAQFLNAQGYRNSKGRTICTQYVANALIVYCGYRKRNYAVRPVPRNKAPVQQVEQPVVLATIEKPPLVNPHKVQPHAYATKYLGSVIPALPTASPAKEVKPKSFQDILNEIPESTLLTDLNLVTTMKLIDELSKRGLVVVKPYKGE